MQYVDILHFYFLCFSCRNYFSVWLWRLYPIARMWEGGFFRNIVAKIVALCQGEGNKIKNWEECWGTSVGCWWNVCCAALLPNFFFQCLPERVDLFSRQGNVRKRSTNSIVFWNPCILVSPLSPFDFCFKSAKICKCRLTNSTCFWQVAFLDLLNPWVFSFKFFFQNSWF